MKNKLLKKALKKEIDKKIKSFKTLNRVDSQIIMKDLERKKLLEKLDYKKYC